MADAANHRLLLEALSTGDAELAVHRLMDSLQGAMRRTASAAHGRKDTF